MTEWGAPKVELNPKLITILKNNDFRPYIHIKHGTLKIQCYSFSNTDTFKRIIAISFVIHGITHFTFMLLISVSFNFTDILHNKCNSHTFCRRFQSNSFSEKHKLSPKLP